MTTIHAGLYRLTRGRVGAKLKGVPILLLTTTGRKSGQPRTSPVMDIRVEGDTYVIASNNGSERHPAWFLNLEANPEVHVVQGSRSYDAKAVLLDDAERDRVYAQAKEQMDNFVRYEQRASRTIPVVRLDPQD